MARPCPNATNWAGFDVLASPSGMLIVLTLALLYLSILALGVDGASPGTAAPRSRERG